MSNQLMADDDEPVSADDPIERPDGIWSCDDATKRRCIKYDCGQFGFVRCYTRGDVRRLMAALKVEAK